MHGAKIQDELIKQTNANWELFDLETAKVWAGLTDETKERELMQKFNIGDLSLAVRWQTRENMSQPKMILHDNNTISIDGVVVGSFTINNNEFHLKVGDMSIGGDAQSVDYCKKQIIHITALWEIFPHSRHGAKEVIDFVAYTLGLNGIEVN